MHLSRFETIRETNQTLQNIMATAPPAPVPSLYRFVFLWLEPVSTLTGAVYAYFFQAMYLDLTHAPSAPGADIPMATSVVLSQLANLYLGLSCIEASILRATADVKVWNALMVCLLLADFGHLYSVLPVGADIYWAYWRWNAIDYGNVPFVYFLAITRICMLLGVGFPQEDVRLKST